MDVGERDAASGAVAVCADNEVVRTDVGSAGLPPGPRGLPLVGVLPRIWRDPLGFFQRVAADYGGVARFGNNRFTLYLLSDPAAIEHVLVDRADNYWKGEGLAAARTVMGEGLATSHGETWRRQRRLMQPAFASQRLLAFLPEVEREADLLAERWEVAARGPGTCDVAGDTSAVVQRLIFRGLFGSDVATVDCDELGAALAVASDFIHRSAWSLIRLPEAVPTPARVRFRRAMATLDRILYGLIAERRARGGDDADLLGRLLAARDEETGERMNDRQVRDEVMTVFVAGHDTTAAGLAWAFYVLAQRPELAAGLHDEGATARFIQEVLRLYPPGWVLVRTPIEDDVIGGYRVPAGAPLLISQWVVHRRPDLWPDPERADPERFLPENSRGRARMAYFPYGGGSRTCIGNTLADIMLGTVVARVAPRVRFDLDPGRAVAPQPGISLQPKGGMQLRVSVVGGA